MNKKVIIWLLTLILISPFLFERISEIVADNKEEALALEIIESVKKSNSKLVLESIDVNNKSAYIIFTLDSENADDKKPKSIRSISQLIKTNYCNVVKSNQINSGITNVMVRWGGKGIASIILSKGFKPSECT